MSVNNLERDHFFGDQRYDLEAENPEPADPEPVVPGDAPQVPGARYNPVMIAEPTDPPSVEVPLPRDEYGNVERANVAPGQVDSVAVAGGAQVGFTKDPRPDDVRRSYRPEHQKPGDLVDQADRKKLAAQGGDSPKKRAANQRAAVKRSGAAKAADKK